MNEKGGSFITQKELKEILEYNPKTGIFTCRIPTSNKYRVGDILGTSDIKGYAIISIYNKKYRAHRLAFLYMKGYFPENDVDHKDRVKWNNKWNNLRESSRQCNMRNKSVQINNKSGISGVYFNKREQRWISRINVSGKSIFIGGYKNFNDAVLARWKKEVELNWNGCNSTSSAYIYLQEQRMI